MRPGENGRPIQNGACLLTWTRPSRSGQTTAMAKQEPKPKSLALPPFPTLRWNGDAWEGEDVLPSWAGFQSRGGAYTSRSSKRPSTGKVDVRVGLPGLVDDDDDPAPPGAEQVAAYKYLKDHEQEVAKAALKAIFDKYPEFQGIYGDDFDEDDAAAALPDLKSPQDLRKLIGLGIVHVLPVAKAGVAYVGFELGCTWDDEHGLGVMLHRDRVIKVGGADTSFLEWVAKGDGGKMLGK